MSRPTIGKTLLTLLLLMASAAAAELRVSSTDKQLPLAGVAASSNATDPTFTIPFFPSTANSFGRQGFARIVNRSDSSGTVTITAFDDSGRRYDPVTLVLDPRRTVHFNSGDLEDGNADKIAVGIGPAAQGDWRLDLTSDLEIKVLSYIRTRDGFVTSMHDLAPSDGNRHSIAFFNPGSNTAQVSYLRLVNPGEQPAAVTVRGVDDAGDAAPGGNVRFSIPAHGASTLDAHELEEGAVGLNGALGDGVGKWSLTVEADRPVMAMSMLGTPTGHLTNLSTDPGQVEIEIPDDAPPAPTVTAISATEIRAEWTWEYQSGDSDLFDLQIRAQGGSWQSVCRDYGGGASGTYTYSWTVTGANPNTSYDVRYRHRPSGSCDSGTPGAWSGIGSARTPSDGGGSSQAPDLVVESVSVSDSSPDAGAPFTLNATVRNGGDGSADATTLRYFRSTNSTISSGDTGVGTDSVRALSGSATSAESISLTAPSSAGTYYFGACVDSVSGESSSANNCSDGVPVEVAGGGDGGGRAGECVEGNTYNPGDGCDVYGVGSSSKERFSVLSDGRGRFAFFTAGNSITNRGVSINGVRYHFVASHQGGSVWKVDEYRP